EADIDCHWTTVRRVMGSKDYHKCVACRKTWISRDLEKKRVQWCQRMLHDYPTVPDWQRVRSSDEVHFSLGPQGKLLIIRHRGERYCRKCIQEVGEQFDTDMRRVHGWGAAGNDFKSELVTYDVPSNSNGKMTQRVYVDAILEPHIKPWIQRGDIFVLEEDQDSSHGPPWSSKKENIVQKWKRQNGLHSYFNCAGSPDLAIIEDCWQPTKQYIRKFAHWEPDETQQLATYKFVLCFMVPGLRPVPLVVAEDVAGGLYQRSKQTW
ncbi:hypothetical protein P152DRAFT_386531, partial [Eremomyces bilateralis CBS 781.70]